jgi:hypothetical protein
LRNPRKRTLNDLRNVLRKGCFTDDDGDTIIQYMTYYYTLKKEAAVYSRVLPQSPFPLPSKPRVSSRSTGLLALCCFAVALGSTQLPTEMGTRIRRIMFLGSKARPVRKADNLTAICEPIV